MSSHMTEGGQRILYAFSLGLDLMWFSPNGCRSHELCPTYSLPKSFSRAGHIPVMECR